MQPLILIIKKKRGGKFHHLSFQNIGYI